MASSDFYVYVHRKASDNSIFYIGKGRGDRAFRKNRKQNPHWIAVAEKHGVIVEIVFSSLSEDDAFKREADLISGFREIGAKLTNITSGGDGVFSGEKAKEVCSKAGKIGGKVAGPVVGRMFAEKKIGVCAPGIASKAGKIGGAITGKQNALLGRGVCDPKYKDHPMKIVGASNAGKKTRDMKKGIHAPGMASAGGKIGGKMPWWHDPVTNKKTRAFAHPGGSFIPGYGKRNNGSGAV